MMAQNVPLQVSKRKSYGDQHDDAAAEPLNPQQDDHGENGVRSHIAPSSSNTASATGHNIVCTSCHPPIGHNIVCTSCHPPIGHNIVCTSCHPPIDKAVNGVKTLKLKKRRESIVTKDEIDELRADLKSSFQSPYQVCVPSSSCFRGMCCCLRKISRVCPRSCLNIITVKFILQFIQLVLVTILLAAFFEEHVRFESYYQSNLKAFRHIFVSDWDADYDHTGNEEYILFTKKELFRHMDFVLDQYNRYDDLTLTTLRAEHNDLVSLNINYVRHTELDQSQTAKDTTPSISNHTYYLPRNLRGTTCNGTTALEKCYSLQEYLKNDNHSIDFHEVHVVTMTMALHLHGMNIQVYDDTSEVPESIDTKCSNFSITIEYDNSKGSGQFILTLSTNLDQRSCDQFENNNDRGQSKLMTASTNLSLRNGETFGESVVLLFCLVNMVLVAFIWFERRKLWKRTKKLFKEHYGVNLTTSSERFKFFGLWNLQHLLTDLLVGAATIYKLVFRYWVWSHGERFEIRYHFNAATCLLAFASLFQWFGMIHYISYLKSSYVVMLTVAKSLPAVMRFLLSGSLIFVGYMHAGWLILGPYLEKFHTKPAAALTLFSMVNGEEFYSTMTSIKFKEHPEIMATIAWIYLLSFVLLYIFVIFNLFIAIINTSYETVQNKKERKKRFLTHFLYDSLEEDEDYETDSEIQIVDEREGDQEERKMGRKALFAWIYREFGTENNDARHKCGC